MCGSSKAKSSSVSTYKPTAEAGALYSSLLQNAQQTAQTPYNPATQKTAAGFNPDQLAAFSNINSNAGGFQPWLNQAASYATQGAGPIGADQIAQYMNPYQQMVIDSTMENINHQNQVQQAGLLGNVAGQQGLNNSRAGVAQAELARGQNANTNQTISQLLSGGFGQALSAAQNDASRQQNAAGQFANLAGAQQQLSMNDIMAQLSAGNQQQQQQQNVNDMATANAQQQTMWPYQNNQWLAGLASGIGPLLGGTTTGNSTTQQGKGGAGQILGAGLSLMSMMSDRRAKEDVSEVGRTHDGQPIYKFRYKGSPRFQMGLMADEVQRSHPEAVSTGPDGMKMVNYDTATERSEGFAKGGGVGFPDTFFPWADIKPAASTVPQLMSAPSQQQGGGFDPKKFMELGKSAGAGFDSFARSIDPAGGWGASIEPAGSTGKGLGSGLSSLLSGFAAGGGVWGDFDPLRDLATKREPDSTDLDIFDPMPPPLENELGGAPAQSQKVPGGFGEMIGRAPMFSNAKTTPVPAAGGEGTGAPAFGGADLFPDLGTKPRDTSGGLNFNGEGFGLYGREPERRAVADTEAGDPFFLGSGDLTDGQDVPFRAREEVKSAGPGLSTQDFVKEQEGWQAQPKWDKRQWTNGWGTRASGPDDVIDEAEADRRLGNELGKVETWIDKNVKVPMTAQQRTGLASAGFNLGTGALDKLKGDINAGAWPTVSERLLTFNKALNEKTGKLEPDEGLTVRRQREAALINQTDSLPEGNAAPLSGGRGPYSNGAVPALVAKGKDPEAPTVGKYETKADKATGGLLKRLFGVDFNPLKLDEDERMAMLTAGLGMMASGNIGTGGLMGMQYLTNKQAAREEADLAARKLAVELYKVDAKGGKEQSTNDIKEFEYATERGDFAGTFPEFLAQKKLRDNSAALPAEVAARIGLGNAFIADLPEIEKGVKAMGLKDNANLAAGRGKAADLWRRIESGTEAMKRNMTGAGMSLSEAENYIARYQISPTDSTATKLSKLRLLKRDLTAAAEGAMSGKLGLMGQQFRRDQATPPPAPTGEAGPSGMRTPGTMPRPGGKSDDQLYGEAASALRSGKDPAAVRARLEAWGLDPSRVSP